MLIWRFFLFVPYRAIGEALEETLTAFSLPIVGMVAEYAVCGTARPKATPQLVFGVASENLLPTAAYGIATSPDGRHMWATSEGKLSLFDAEAGRHLLSLEDDAVRFSQGICINGNGEIWLASDSQGCVVVCKADGGVVRTMGFTELWLPQGLALHRQLAFVADPFRSRVQVLDCASGKFVRGWGSKGTGMGQFSLPTNLTVSDDGQVFVSDRRAGTIQVCPIVGSKFDVA